MAIKLSFLNNFLLRLKKNVFLVLAIALTFVAFSPTLRNPFITNDDPGHLLNNEMVKSLSWENIDRIFSQEVCRTYIPLTVLSFALEYRLFGFNSTVYHLNNLLLHLGVMALIYFISVKWLRLSVLAAGLAALFFGIHPMHVESVAWITERKDVLYSLFYLLAIERYCAYVHSDRRRDYFLVLLYTLLSILSKAMALSLPLVFFVLDWFWGRKLSVKLILEKVPCFLIIVPVAMVTYLMNARVVGTTAFESVLTWIWCLMFYPQKFFFPDVLLPIYSLPKPVSLANFEFLKVVFLFFVAVGLIVRFYKNKWIIFSVMYYLCSIFFLLRFDDAVDVNFVADRFMYLPSLGFCIAVAVGIEQLTLRNDFRWVWAFVVGACIFMMIKTFTQTQIWGDGIKLWSGVIERDRDNFYAYDHRGFAFAQSRQYQRAIEDYTQAIRIKPGYTSAYHNRALALNYLGQKEEALEEFENVFRLNPNAVSGYYNRGVLFLDNGQLEKAIRDFSRAIEESGGLYGQALMNRGAIYMMQKQYDLALIDLNAALALDSRDISSLNNRAIIFVMQRDHSRALSDLNEALRFAPNDPGSYYNRALVYIEISKLELALADLKRVIKLVPGHREAIEKKASIEKFLSSHAVSLKPKKPPLVLTW